MVMRVSAFCKYYNISNTQIPELKKEHPEAFSWENNSCITYIETDYFLKLKNFKKSVKMFNQDMFMVLNEYWNTSRIAKAIAIYDGNVTTSSINEYLRVAMFCLDSDSLMNYKLTKLEQITYDFFTEMKEFIENDILHKCVDLNEILDKRID